MTVVPMSEEPRALTYEELQTQVMRLRSELNIKDRALNEALREIVILRDAIHEKRRSLAPRVLDPNSTDAFSRPFR